MARSLRDELKLTKRRFQSLEEEAFLGVQRTADMLLYELNKFLREYDLSHGPYNVLRILRGAGHKGLPCSEIKARMVNRVPDITRLCDRLARRGLVRRRKSDEDRRVVNVVITEAGLDLLDRIDPPLAKLQEEQFGHLTSKHLRQMNLILELLRDR